MADRLNVLQKVTDPSYAEGSPLLLEACALYQDTVTGMRIAQLKWSVLDPRTVKAVSVELKCTDAFGQAEPSVSYQYDGLAAKQYEEFGSREAIQIQGPTVSRYDVVLKAVSFADGTFWKADADEVMTSLPKPVKQTLSGEMLDQLKRDISTLGIYQ